MPILTDFSVSVFNGLVSDYHDVRHFGDFDKKLPEMTPVINRFGDVFIKHQKEEHAGLSLSHRHFKLNDGEMKVAKQENDTTLSIKATSDEEIHAFLEKNEGAKVLPYLFLPTSNGDKVSLHPLEYVLLTDKKLIAKLEADINTVCDMAFLKDFLALASNNGVDGVYGITLRSRDSLNRDDDRTTLEGSGAEDRSLVVKVVDKSKMSDGGSNNDITTVAWHFSKDSDSGKVIPMSACSSLHHDHPITHGPACYYHYCHHCSHSYCTH